MKFYVDSRLQVFTREEIERMARRQYIDRCAWEIDRRGRVVRRATQMETLTSRMRIIEWQAA